MLCGEMSIIRFIPLETSRRIRRINLNSCALIHTKLQLFPVAEN